MIDALGLPFAEFDPERTLRLSLAGRKVQQSLAGKPLGAVEVEPKSQIEIAIDAHLKAKAEIELGSRDVAELRMPGGKLIAYGRENLGDLDRAIASLRRKGEFAKRRLA